jgi:hypothetical protein
MSGEDLLKASEKGDLSEVDRLLLEGVDMNYRNNVRYMYIMIWYMYIYYIYYNHYYIF